MAAASMNLLPDTNGHVWQPLLGFVAAQSSYMSMRTKQMECEPPLRMFHRIEYSGQLLFSHLDTKKVRMVSRSPIITQ